MMNDKVLQSRARVDDLSYKSRAGRRAVSEADEELSVVSRGHQLDIPSARGMTFRFLDVRLGCASPQTPDDPLAREHGLPAAPGEMNHIKNILRYRAPPFRTRLEAGRDVHRKGRVGSFGGMR